MSEPRAFLPQRRERLGLILASLSAPALLRAESLQPLRVRYAKPPRGFDESSWFPLQLLRRVLEASGEAHQIESSRYVVVQERATRDLVSATDTVDLLWTMTSRQREALLRPVRVPIDRGLYGWRLLLLRRGEAGRFAGVKSLQALRRFTLLQGSEWPDTEILRANALTVSDVPSLIGLFALLERGIGHAIPRAVEEIWWEEAQYAPRFEVEPSLALRYPTAMYYFTAPGNTRLAEALERGLARLLASGEFQRLFDAHHGPLLARARMAERRVLTLRNPLLPEATPLDDARLWWRP